MLACSAAVRRATLRSLSKLKSAFDNLLCLRAAAYPATPHVLLEPLEKRQMFAIKLVYLDSTFPINIPSPAYNAPSPDNKITVADPNINSSDPAAVARSTSGIGYFDGRQSVTASDLSSAGWDSRAGGMKSPAPAVPAPAIIGPSRSSPRSVSLLTIRSSP